MVRAYPFELLINPRRGAPGLTVLSAAGFRRAKAAITGWPGYLPTPLRSLPSIAGLAEHTGGIIKTLWNAITFQPAAVKPQDIPIASVPQGKE